MSRLVKRERLKRPLEADATDADQPVDSVAGRPPPPPPAAALSGLAALAQGQLPVPSAVVVPPVTSYTHDHGPTQEMAHDDPHDGGYAQGHPEDYHDAEHGHGAGAAAVDDGDEDSAQDDSTGGGGAGESAGGERKSLRRKINIEFIADKSRRHITFSKRKAGIMKKVADRRSPPRSGWRLWPLTLALLLRRRAGMQAYELSTLTGTEVLLLVASETGHVYTFATPKLQPLITKQEGKNLIQSCLNSPDVPSAAAAATAGPANAGGGVRPPQRDGHRGIRGPALTRACRCIFGRDATAAATRRCLRRRGSYGCSCGRQPRRQTGACGASTAPQK